MSVNPAPLVAKCKRFAAVILTVILTATYTGGCASTPQTQQQVTYRLALVSESYATALQRLQQWEIGEHRAGKIPDADHTVWQRRFQRLAEAGKVANDAIRASQMPTVQAQARAIIDILGELVDEQVIRLSPDQRTLATIILESMRTAVLVWSATLDVRTLGDPCVLDAVALEAA